jgi:hypothetical protein
MPPSERLGDPLPADLEGIVLALLAKEPSDRPSAPALLRRLEECASCGSWSQSEAQTWWQRWGPRLRERRRSEDATAKASKLAVDLGDRGLASPPAA